MCMNIPEQLSLHKSRVADVSLGTGNILGICVKKKLAAAGILVAPIRLLWSCDLD